MLLIWGAAALAPSALDLLTTARRLLAAFRKEIAAIRSSNKTRKCTPRRLPRAMGADLRRDAIVLRKRGDPRLGRK
jgi:hypothetical protein